MNGLALTILIGQLPKLFGFSTDANGLIDEAHGVRPRARRRRGRRRRRRDRRVSLAVILAACSAGCRGCRACWSAVVARDRGGGRLRSRRPRRLAGRDPAQGVSAAHRARVRYPISRCWWLARSGSRSSPLADTISTASAFAARTGPGGRRQRGDDRDRRRQHRGRVLSGVPGQHERVAHRGRRAGRREDAGHRARRGVADRADARARPRAAARTSRSRRSPRS